MTADKCVLRCDGLAVGYKGKTVLSGLNFEFAAGTMTVLIGANGSGKSTLLRTLAGQQPPLEGRIELDGAPITSYSRHRLAKARAIVGTSREGGGGLTVEETVAIGRYAYTGWTGLLSEEDRKIVAEAMEAVGVTAFRNRFLANMSDGEKQKVMIARALAQNTRLLILDEPTAFLDVAARVDIMRLLRSLADSGRTILLSTHDIAPSVRYADSILAIDAAENTASLDTKDNMIESGKLNRVFAESGLHFDAAACDFR